MNSNYKNTDKKLALNDCMWLLLLVVGPRLLAPPLILLTSMALSFRKNNTLSHLKALDLEITCNLQICCHIKWLEEGESCSSRFLQLIKKNSVDLNIMALRADDGSVISDLEGQCKLLPSFFSASPCDPVA